MMGLIRDIALLEPRTRAAAEQAIAILRAHGIRFWINETLRARATQEAYFARGRQPLELVNTLRKEAGLWPITATENTKTVTSTLKSLHLEGKALDICPADNAGGPLWSAPREEYEKIATVMKTCGFDWGGDWKGFQDCPHYQIREAKA